MLRGLVVGTAVFSVVLSLFASYYNFPLSGEVLEALNIIEVGLLVLAIYGAIVYTMSRAVRELDRGRDSKLEWVD